MTVINLRDVSKEQRRAIGPHWPIVRIDRTSRWGNPYKIGDPDPNGQPMDRPSVLALYRTYLTAKVRDQPDYLEPLRGKMLACWCAPEPCHGDIIKEYLNAA